MLDVNRIYEPFADKGRCVKPLLAKDLQNFLDRFNNFRDGEFRSIEVISPSVITVTFAGQDTGREFNWVSMKFEFSGVDDARLIENSKLSFVDMSEGITILHEDNKFAFGIGERYNISTVKNSVCYLISSSLKYQEGEF